MPAHAPSLAADGAAIENLQAADRAKPLTATGLSDLVGLLAAAKRDAEASAYAARLLKLRPTHRRALRALTRSPPADVDVIGGWRALAETTPDDPEPWLQIARLAARAGDGAAALEAGDEVLARADGHAEALGLKLTALSILGAHDAIGEAWRQLHAADPARARTLADRAADKADIDSAAAMLGEAGALGALDAEGELRRLRLRSWLTVEAFEAELAGDMLEAARAFARLTRLEPNAADYADGLARAIGRPRARIEGAVAAGDAGPGDGAAEALSAGSCFDDDAAMG
ncbi:MAG: hypothetical protein ACR2F8_03380 [Caulobacteraceae bacterium]